MTDYTQLIQEIRSNTRGSVALDLSRKAADAIEDLTRVYQSDQSDDLGLCQETEKSPE